MTKYLNFYVSYVWECVQQNEGNQRHWISVNSFCPVPFENSVGNVLWLLAEGHDEKIIKVLTKERKKNSILNWTVDSECVCDTLDIGYPFCIVTDKRRDETYFTFRTVKSNVHLNFYRGEKSFACVRTMSVRCCCRSRTKWRAATYEARKKKRQKDRNEDDSEESECWSLSSWMDVWTYHV